MSDNLIRCIHENGKVCFLTKAATENRNFMKKYGIRVEHVQKESPKSINITIDATEVKQVLAEALEEAKKLKAEETNPEAEAEAVDKQVSDALAEATKDVVKPTKPKATRKRATKPKTNKK